MATTVTYPELVEHFRTTYPNMGLILPPLADSGLCGRCGEPVDGPAPRGLHRVPPTDLLVEILLCPNHVGDSDS